MALSSAADAWNWLQSVIWGAGTRTAGGIPKFTSLSTLGPSGQFIDSNGRLALSKGIAFPGGTTLDAAPVSASVIKHYASMVIQSTSPSIATGTISRVAFDTIVSDADGALVDGTNSKWTAPYTGYFQITASVGWNNNTNATYVALYNDATSALVTVLCQLYLPNSTQWADTGGTSPWLHLNAGDALHLAVEQASGSPRSLGSSSDPAYRNFFTVVGV